MSERPTCSIEGCSNLAALHRTRKGRREYRRTCDSHHKIRYRMRGIKRQGYAKGIRHLSQQPCSECGWDKGPTDKHRIDPSRGYEADNLVPLCPNCHRLVTLELINV